MATATREPALPDVTVPKYTPWGSWRVGIGVGVLLEPPPPPPHATINAVRDKKIRLKSLLHNLESDLKTHVSVDHVVRKC
jgi:hypothetical protein